MPRVAGGSTRARRITIGAACRSPPPSAPLRPGGPAASRGLADPTARAGDRLRPGRLDRADRAPRGPRSTRATRPRCGCWPGHRPGSAATTRPSRSTAAIATGRMEAEDYVLLGLALQRRRQPDEAARAGRRRSTPRPSRRGARGAGPPPHPGPSLGGGGPGRRAARARARLGGPGADDARHHPRRAQRRPGAAESFRLALDRDPRRSTTPPIRSGSAS